MRRRLPVKVNKFSILLLTIPLVLFLVPQSALAEERLSADAFGPYLADSAVKVPKIRFDSGPVLEIKTQKAGPAPSLAPNIEPHLDTGLRDLPNENRYFSTLDLYVPITDTLRYQFGYGASEPAPLCLLDDGLSAAGSAGFTDPSYFHRISGGLMWKTPIDGLLLEGRYSQYIADNLCFDAPQRPKIADYQGRMGSLRIDRMETSVAAAEHTFGRFRLRAEYLRNTTEYTDPEGNESLKEGEGYLGEAGLQLTDWMELGSSYAIYYGDRRDRTGSAWTAIGKKASRAWIRDFALSTRFAFNDTLILELEGHFMNGLLGLSNWDDEQWMRFTTELSFRF